MRRRRWRLVALLVVVAWIASAPGSAAGFGTIDSGGQNREHERITRAALACAGSAEPTMVCFEPRSIDYLAGHDREFGAIGAPDSDELSDPTAHCDNSDFHAGDYPRTRDQATATVMDCLRHLRSRFGAAVDNAHGLLDDQGRPIDAEARLEPECKLGDRTEARAKCASLEGFGRVLHGAQDFYAHSNWADEADPDHPSGVDNPPGLNLPGPSPLLDLRSAATPSVPFDLTTGCYVLRDEVPGVGECAQRVTHAALNKDRGLIDPDTGKATGPTTPRGMVGDNFAKAVSGAIAETRRQWQDFQAELTTRYGEERAELMICTLTRDDPVNVCRSGEWDGRTIGALAVGFAVAVVAIIMLVIRRRRRRRI
jgi:hypothetical protein